MERMMTRPARGLPRAAALAACLALSACSIGDLPLRSVLVELGYAWEQAARVEAEVPAVDDQFGRAVAVYGDWAAVGDNEDDSYRGAVYVYRKTNGIWSFSQKIAGASANDILGTSVALYGDYLLIGAPGVSSDAGRAYLYKLSGSTWVLHRTLQSPYDDLAGYFGMSAALTDSYAFVGAPYHGAHEGRVYAFYSDELGADNWGAPSSGQTLQREAPAARTMGDEFGSAVAASGDYAIVGIPEPNLVTPSGGASIFHLSVGTWTQTTVLVSDNPAFDYFGSAVSISGDVAAVGAPDEEAVYVYARSGSSWTPELVVASDAGTGPKFGSSVAVDGALLAVGAPEDDGAAGSVYFFRRDSEGWKQERKLSASDSSAGAQVGSAAALCGYDAVAAALGNTTPDLAGAAYFFVRTR